MSLLGVFLFSQSGSARDKATIPEYTVEGLKLIPDTKDIALVWADPDADLAQYERVYLLEPFVAFIGAERFSQLLAEGRRLDAHGLADLLKSVDDPSAD